MSPRKSGRGSRPERPLHRLLDVLGRRWALRIVWELRGGPLTFRELQDACGGISPSVLNTRLYDLREVGVIEEGFTLTKEGERLLEALTPMDAWAKRWARRAGY